MQIFYLHMNNLTFGIILFQPNQDSFLILISLLTKKMYDYDVKVPHYAQDISCIVEPINNKGGIYLSNMQTALNAQILKKRGIRAVITACQGVLLPHSTQILEFYMYIPAKDHELFNLSFYFEDASNFISKTLEHTNILIHCMAGISRSASLIIAYLIKFKRYTYNQALLLLRNRRKIVNPNRGFMKQLKIYETLYCNEKSNRMWSPKNNKKFEQDNQKNKKINFAWSQYSEKYETKIDTYKNNTKRQLIATTYGRVQINSPKKQIQNTVPFKKTNNITDFTKEQLSSQQRKKRVEYLCKKYARKNPEKEEKTNQTLFYKPVISYQDNSQQNTQYQHRNSKIYTPKTLFTKKYEK